MKSDSFVSVVLVHEQPLSRIKSNLLEIHAELDANYSDYEVLIIGQCQAIQFSQLDEDVLKNTPSLRFIQLSSKVQQDVAWGAALENAIGDFVVMFDPILDPVKAITETVAVCKSGFDVVVGVTNQSRSWTYKLFRSMADKILTFVDYSLPRNASSLRCLSRRAVNSVTRTGRFHHQLSMQIQKTGYPQTAYSYELLTTDHMSKPTSLITGIRNLLHLVVFNSSRPLRWMTGLGLFGSFSAVVFALYSLLIHLVKGSVVEGWTTTILFMSSFFMMQFIMMAFFGEYIGRLLDNHSNQDDYSVVFEKNSSVMINQDRVNVLSDPEKREENKVQTGRDK
jgi:polyisoprenyl-phosphate glycosyltransferase